MSNSKLVTQSNSRRTVPNHLDFEEIDRSVLGVDVNSKPGHTVPNDTLILLSEQVTEKPNQKVESESVEALRISRKKYRHIHILPSSHPSQKRLANLRAVALAEKTKISAEIQKTVSTRFYLDHLERLEVEHKAELEGMVKQCVADQAE